VTKAQAQALAQEWIEAFNNHDLERILSHYADSVELKSLLVTKLLGDPAGTVRRAPTPPTWIFTPFEEICRQDAEDRKRARAEYEEVRDVTGAAALSAPLAARRL